MFLVNARLSLTLPTLSNLELHKFVTKVHNKVLRFGRYISKMLDVLILAVNTYVIYSEVQNF